jgi:type II restriction/modification system DNA methylase subunit YeeA
MSSIIVKGVGDDYAQTSSKMDIPRESLPNTYLGHPDYTRPVINDRFKRVSSPNQPDCILDTYTNKKYWGTEDFKEIWTDANCS